jgi:hypothetical protein
MGLVLTVELFISHQHKTIQHTWNLATGRVPRPGNSVEGYVGDTAVR